MEQGQGSKQAAATAAAAAATTATAGRRLQSIPAPGAATNHVQAGAGFPWEIQGMYMCTSSNGARLAPCAWISDFVPRCGHRKCATC